MKVITCNVNGIRSVSSKGFVPWLKKQNADLICLQEIRATVEQFPDALREIPGYVSYIKPATRPGYSGVAVYSRVAAKSARLEMGHPELDGEGRFVSLEFEKFVLASVYFPSGSSGPHRQAKKYEFLEHFYEHLSQYRRHGKSHIICGDWNIAHKQIDLKNWRSNQKNSGFLPEERAWMDRVIDELGFVDAFRVVNQLPDQYTWWSNRGRARDNNVGWRIDYQIVTPCLKERIRDAQIYKQTFFSDHAPLTIEYDLEF